MGDARSASGIGSGGMVSKLQAAKIATHAGAHLAIISGKVERPLSAFAATGRGTVFVAPPRARAKKAWLAGRLTVTGAIHIDEGAAGALARGKSLLAAGAPRVEGEFRRGDPVDTFPPGRGRKRVDEGQSVAARGGPGGGRNH